MAVTPGSGDTPAWFGATSIGTEDAAGRSGAIGAAVTCGAAAGAVTGIGLATPAASTSTDGVATGAGAMGCGTCRTAGVATDGLSTAIGSSTDMPGRSGFAIITGAPTGAGIDVTRIAARRIARVALRSDFSVVASGKSPIGDLAAGGGRIAALFPSTTGVGNVATPEGGAESRSPTE